jgi:hypothetical protein
LKKPKTPAGTPENRELAFRTYAAMGGRDIPGVLERLRKDYGLDISAQTLYRWRKEGGWALRMPPEEKRGETSGFELRLFHRLARLIERYEAELERRPKVESQEIFAYAGLARAALEVSRKLPPAAKDPGELRRIAAEILENDFGVKQEEDNPPWPGRGRPFP